MITWIARTVIPLPLAPEHGGAPPLSQICSFKVTEPIPGTRIVVLGGGLLLTVIPATASPSRLVPCGLDEDVPPPEELLACEVIVTAEAVHTPNAGKTQTFCAVATLDELLLEELDGKEELPDEEDELPEQLRMRCVSRPAAS